MNIEQQIEQTEAKLAELEIVRTGVFCEEGCNVNGACRRAFRNHAAA
jgi:hypothetical protein